MKILALTLASSRQSAAFSTHTRHHEFQLAATDRNYLTTLFKPRPVDLVAMEAFGIDPRSG